MNITPIPDREAAKKLGVSYATIRNAVDRGDLIRVPMKGQLQHVAEEHIALFEGMSRILKGNLSPSNLKKWEAITEAITSPSTQHQDVHDPLLDQISQMPPAKGMRRRYIVEDEPIDGREVPQGVPFLQRREYIMV